MFAFVVLPQVNRMVLHESFLYQVVWPVHDPDQIEGPSISVQKFVNEVLLLVLSTVGQSVPCLLAHTRHPEVDCGVNGFRCDECIDSVSAWDDSSSSLADAIGP